MKNSKTLQFLKFSLVGSLGLAIDLGITWYGKEELNLNPYLANCGGFSIAVMSNYLLNKYWTFSETSSISLKQFWSFVLVSLGGMVLTTLFLKLFYGIWNIDFYFAKLMVTSLVVVYNFIVNRLLVFTIADKSVLPI